MDKTSQSPTEDIHKQGLKYFLMQTFGKIGYGVRTDTHGADVCVDQVPVSIPRKMYGMESKKADATVAIHIINTPMEVSEVAAIYETDKQNDYHSLFILDPDLLPKKDSIIDFLEDDNHWLGILHGLCYGKLYTYQVISENLITDNDYYVIIPVHCEPGITYNEVLGENQPHEYYVRTMIRGDAVDLGRLKATYIRSMVRQLEGDWHIADFREGPFWQYQSGYIHSDKTRKQTHHTRKESGYGYRTDKTQNEWERWYQDYKEQIRKRAEEYAKTQARAKPHQAQSHMNYDRCPIMDCYTLLGIKPPGHSSQSYRETLDKAKQEYRKLARQYHPDMNNDKQTATSKMQDINVAYERIKKALLS